jgi:hypothetical protein
MKAKYFRLLVVTGLLGMVGCHRMNVGAVTAQLRIGMSKAQIDQVMKGEKFLKEQTLALNPGRTEGEMRASVWDNHTYKSYYPDNLINQKLTFDGSMKAYSYLIKEERPFANPIYVEALFIFVDSKKDEVVGWADIAGLVEVRLWDEIF